MSDPFVAWKVLQDNLLALQKAQVEAAMRLLPRSEHFEGAAKAAQEIAEVNGKAWETWMGIWGFRK